jgi:hypothetical protein
MEYMNEQASERIEDMQNNTENLENQEINPSVNPYSNGTGSGRSVFDPIAKNSINNVNQGQAMGDVMFKKQNLDPTMQNQGPSMTIVNEGKGVKGLLSKALPLAATAATVIGAGKLISGIGKKKSGASIKGEPGKKFKPNKGSSNLHVETSNFAAKAGMGQGNIRGDRAITFDNIENVTTDNTYVKRFKKPGITKEK